MPFAYPDIVSAQKVANTLYAEMPALQKEAKANKLHVLRFALINTYHIMCKQPIRTVEDFKGRKVRSQGDLLPLVLNALGATPVTVLPGEFYEAMQRGSIDCLVLPWDFLASNRIYEVAKHASTINFGPIVAHASMMNLDKWNSLSPEVQKLITDVSKEAEAYDLKVVKESETKSLATIKANGVEIVDFPDQAKLEKMIPDLFAVWAERMSKAGNGEQAQAMVKRWKELR
jgi:TRAP-type C4-dicarboxylate transport system substrate-binding protein